MASSISWKYLLNQLVAQQDLTQDEVSWAMDEIMTGSTPEAIIGAFLVGLHVKGETPLELAALAQGMLDKAESIEVTQDAVDIVGTGGDQQNTVNISTMASLVAAGAGAPVIKHGNRASTSSSGSADVLAELGINLNMNIKDVAGSVAATGITFLFAQVFHPSMRHVAPVRKSLGVPTAFNYLGPMTNPAKVRASAIGVADGDMAEKIAHVFASRGDHALIFRGSDGLDEITITGPSVIWETHDGGVTREDFAPENHGFTLASIEDLRGGDATHNAQVVRETLQGSEGPILDAVLLNAAAGIVAYRPQDGRSFEERYAQALKDARESVTKGKAVKVLNDWIAYSQAH
ncbi:MULTISPECIES: anthranilate phosphoribosyltransferase [Rothia]|uniref:Anthranilate phosphoribosyltransferase n=1 Tax=Rothia nasimurium TaxID=85336 RepID=A0A1Y1RQD1_9MICC|nr:MULTISPECIES: anthranilate phosphoribosyltransferase [Rothia]ORC21988.1 anthranilate phosphoribosyltransferase [Rothia nasimurium]